MERAKIIKALTDKLVLKERKHWTHSHSLTVAAAFTEEVTYVAHSTNTIPASVIPRYNKKPRGRCDVSLGHAEQMLIGQLADRGISTRNLWIGINFFPCIVCANIIGAARFSNLVAPKPEYNYKPQDYDFRGSEKVLEAWDVEVHKIGTRQE